MSAPDAALEDLVYWLKRHNQSISEVDPFRFEDLIAQFLKERFGPTQVRKVGGRKDMGIDMLVAQAGDDPLFVQVKRRSKLNRCESVATVRTMNGVLLRERSPYGMVITTSKSFSPDAIREAYAVRKNYVDGPFSRHNIELVDLPGVLAMLGESELDRAAYRNHESYVDFENWRKTMSLTLHPRFRRLR
ncbi:hypothetical protein FHR20_001135 [Sphingomonas leidyi]|uniref:Restriction endonuclease type IV Mrr domain-containing protein n=1 Tax=Sphingomonas leidyi TaxID=68569 RepID=A0A7X5UXN9_9SPHN|nr:hypothetical protein [Sphingomonas leidyi]